VVEAGFAGSLRGAAGLLFVAIAGRQLNPGVSMSVVVVFLSYGLLRYAVKSTRERWLKTLIAALILFDLNAFDRLSWNRRDLAAADPNQLDHLLSFRGRGTVPEVAAGFLACADNHGTAPAAGMGSGSLKG